MCLASPEHVNSSKHLHVCQCGLPTAGISWQNWTVVALTTTCNSCKVGHSYTYWYLYRVETSTKLLLSLSDTSSWSAKTMSVYVQMRSWLGSHLHVMQKAWPFVSAAMVLTTARVLLRTNHEFAQSPKHLLCNELQHQLQYVCKQHLQGLYSLPKHNFAIRFWLHVTTPLESKVVSLHLTHNLVLQNCSHSGCSLCTCLQACTVYTALLHLHQMGTSSCTFCSRFG